MAKSSLRNLAMERMNERRARAGMAPYIPQEPTQTAGQALADTLGGVALGTTFIPGYGDVAGLAADAAMYANYPEERTLGNYALTALGALPFVPAASSVKRAIDMSLAAKKPTISSSGVITGQADETLKNLPGRNELNLWVEKGDEAIESGWNVTGEPVVVLDKIYLDPSVRGKGLGRRILQEAVQDAAEVMPGAEIKLLAEPLDSQTELDDLIRLYESVGFDVGEYVDGMSGVPMTMRLPNAASVVRSGKKAADTALDMSQAARMQRAEDMGLDPSFTLYHGTGDDIQEFDLNIAKDMEGRKRGLGLGSGKIYLHGNPQSASAFAMNAPTRGLGQSPNVMQLISTGNYIDENDYKRMFMENSGGVEITSENLSMRERDALIKKTDRQVMEKGFDGIAEKYKDSSGKVVGYGQIAIFDPANIRSVNAAFDPAKRDSSNLMSGIGAAGVLTGSMRQQREDQK